MLNKPCNSIINHTSSYYIRLLIYGFIQFYNILLRIHMLLKICNIIILHSLLGYRCSIRCFLMWVRQHWIKDLFEFRGKYFCSSLIYNYFIINSPDVEILLCPLYQCIQLCDLKVEGQKFITMWSYSITGKMGTVKE